MEKIKSKLENWFYHNLDKHQKRKIALTSIYLLASLILALIIYKNISNINETAFLFLRLGSVLLILILIICIKFVIDLIQIFRRNSHQFSYGYKLLFAVLVFAFILFIYFNQEKSISLVKSHLNNDELAKINPISMGAINSLMNSSSSVGFMSDFNYISKCKSTISKQVKKQQSEAFITFTYTFTDSKVFTDVAEANSFAAQAETIPKGDLCKKDLTKYVGVVIHYEYGNSVEATGGMLQMAENVAVFCDADGNILLRGQYCP